MKKSALLMIGPLKTWTTQRFAYGIIGGMIFPCLLMAIINSLNPSAIIFLTWVMLLINIAGEMMERYLFFTAVIPLKMPH